MSTVLVADDNQDTRSSLAVLLRSRGHDVCLASDGGEAMAVMAERHPDVVVLDLMMPRINGWEMLDSKALSAWASVPVIVLSGWIRLPQPIPDNAGVRVMMDRAADPGELLGQIDRVLAEVKRP